MPVPTTHRTGPRVKNFLPYDEQNALESICRHHHIEDPQALKDLAALMLWVHQYELAKIDRSSRPPLLIALLSMMGVYGKDYLNQPTKDSHA